MRRSRKERGRVSRRTSGERRDRLRGRGGSGSGLGTERRPGVLCGSGCWWEGRAGGRWQGGTVGGGKKNTRNIQDNNLEIACPSFLTELGRCHSGWRVRFGFFSPLNVNEAGSAKATLYSAVYGSDLGIQCSDAVCSHMQYTIDGRVVYTSSTGPQFPLRLDSWMYVGPTSPPPPPLPPSSLVPSPAL